MPSGQGQQNNKNQGCSGCPSLRVSYLPALLTVLCKLGWSRGFSNNDCHWTWSAPLGCCTECSSVSWARATVAICSHCGIRTLYEEVRCPGPGAGLARFKMEPKIAVHLRVVFIWCWEGREKYVPDESFAITIRRLSHCSICARYLQGDYYTQSEKKLPIASVWDLENESTHGFKAGVCWLLICKMVLNNSQGRIAAS